MPTAPTPPNPDGLNDRHVRVTYLYADGTPADSDTRAIPTAHGVIPDADVHWPAKWLWVDDGYPDPPYSMVDVVLRTGEIIRYERDTPLAAEHDARFDRGQTVYRRGLIPAYEFREYLTDPVTDPPSALVYHDGEGFVVVEVGDLSATPFITDLGVVTDSTLNTDNATEVTDLRVTPVNEAGVPQSPCLFTDEQLDLISRVTTSRELCGELDRFLVDTLSKPASHSVAELRNQILVIVFNAFENTHVAPVSGRRKSDPS